MNLHDYDIVIINSSAGKDSLCSIHEICRMADDQLYPRWKIVVSHQDLGQMEWAGTKELAAKQAKLFGLKIYYSQYRNRKGEQKTLLNYVEERGKWPSRDKRYCTSEFKRGPGGTIITMLTKKMEKPKVLYVFGFRKDESPARKKKKKLVKSKRHSNTLRKVYEYLPIHNWTAEKVWMTIRANNLPYHPAYDLGMPRLSCCFCIFSPFDALVIAGKNNPELLERYVEVEKKIGHTFKSDMKIEDVHKAIKNGYQPKQIDDWVM